MIRSLAVVLVLAFTAACATTATKPITDLSTLNGRWTGLGIAPGGTSSSVEWIIKDGRYDATVVFPGGEVIRGTGALRIAGGATIWENPVNTGLLTLREVGGKRVITLEGQNRQSGQPIWGELTEAK